MKYINFLTALVLSGLLLSGCYFAFYETDYLPGTLPQSGESNQHHLIRLSEGNNRPEAPFEHGSGLEYFLQTVLTAALTYLITRHLRIGLIKVLNNNYDGKSAASI